MRGRPRGSARCMPGPGGRRGCGAAGEPTASTHLRQQQADLLHLLQRQQRVADRVLEEHVQQHLEREPGREPQHGSRARPAPAPGADPRPGPASRRNLGPSLGLRLTRTRYHSSPWRLLLARLAMRRAGSGARKLAPEATPPRRRPIRGRGRYLCGPSEGCTTVVAPGGREGERGGAGCLPASAAARAGAVAGDARDAAGPAGRRALAKALSQMIFRPRVFIIGIVDGRARPRPGGGSLAGDPVRATAAIPTRKLLAEPAFRSAGDPRAPPCSPRLPGPLRPRFPLADRPAPADGSGAWGAMAQTPRKQLLVVRFKLFACVLFVTLKK